MAHQAPHGAGQADGAGLGRQRVRPAATGEFERGRIKIADMLARQPWAGEIPVELATTPAPTPTVPLPTGAATAGA
jgi:hypothetical protein